MSTPANENPFSCPPPEALAEGLANLCVALSCPEFTAKNRDRFVDAVHQLQEVFAEDTPVVLWYFVVGHLRMPTSDELAALGLPEIPAEFADAKAAFERSLMEKVMDATAAELCPRRHSEEEGAIVN